MCKYSYVCVLYLENGILSFSSYWSLVLINFVDNSCLFNSYDFQEHSAEEARTFCSCRWRSIRRRYCVGVKCPPSDLSHFECLKELELLRSVILSQEALTDYFIFQLRWLSLSLAESESEIAQLCPTLCDPMDTRLLRPWDFLGKSTGVGCHFLRHGIFLTQGSNQVSRIVDRHFTVRATRWVRLTGVKCGGGGQQELGDGPSSVTWHGLP